MLTNSKWWANTLNRIHKTAKKNENKKNIPNTEYRLSYYCESHIRAREKKNVWKFQPNLLCFTLLVHGMRLWVNEWQSSEVKKKSNLDTEQKKKKNYFIKIIRIYIWYCSMKRGYRQSELRTKRATTIEKNPNWIPILYIHRSLLLKSKGFVYTLTFTFRKGRVVLLLLLHTFGFHISIVSE